MGDKFFLGGGGRLLCRYKITIGNNTWFPFGVIVSDTDFHFISHRGEIKNCCTEVFIGNNVWVGYFSSIHKGSLPDNCIVASRSLINKNFLEAGDNGILLAGIPAQIKGADYHRITSSKITKKLREEFSIDPNKVISSDTI